MNKRMTKLTLAKKEIVNYDDLKNVKGGEAGFTDGCTDGCGPVTVTHWNCTKADCTNDCNTNFCDTREFCTM